MAALTLTDVDFVAVLVAALAYNLLGFAWYHPKVFGTKWMRLSGRDGSEGAGMAIGVSIAASIVAAVALAVLVVAFDAQHWVDGLGVGALVGVGFLVPVLAVQTVFAGRPLALYFLDVTYQVLGFILMGVVLALWP